MANKADKILIVDDLKEILAVLTEIVQSGGYTNIAAFCDSKKAKEYLLENEVDVLVTDLQMPEVNRIELIDIAFKMKVRRIIAVSGMIQKSESLQKALKTLGVTFIEKPFKTGDLLNAIAG